MAPKTLATTGFDVRNLTFLPHHLSIGAEAMQKEGHTFMSDLATAKQAVVEFPNGWSASLINYIPSDRGMMILHGDSRIPTYEIMVIDADGNSDDPHYDMSVVEANRLLRAVMSEGYVGGAAQLANDENN